MSVTFMQRRHNQCCHFLPGESGMNGLVCGDPVVTGKAWCRTHLGQVYPPQPQRRMAWGTYDHNVDRSPGEDHEPDLTEMFT